MPFFRIMKNGRSMISMVLLPSETVQARQASPASISTHPAWAIFSVTYSVISSEQADSEGALPDAPPAGASLCLFLEYALGAGAALKLRVVEDHQLAVFGQMDVELRPETVLDGAAERGQRVLRNVRFIVKASVRIAVPAQQFKSRVSGAACKCFFHLKYPPRLQDTALCRRQQSFL